KDDIKVAHINITPKQLVKRSILLSFSSAIAVTFFSFVIIESQRGSLSILPLIFLFTLIFIFFFVLNIPKVYIRRREREINKEVLFAGRYLLVKLESGTPLFNALIDASKGYGIAGRFFKEIVDDISTGTPIEEALEKARKYNSSKSFNKILWQIITALKTGAEVVNPLKATLKQITQDQVIEIKEYGKKLNSLVMFYMIIACVMPSLGITMIVILSSFVELDITMTHLFVVLFFLAVVQFFFISLIKSSRPMVNI
ncbi:MAG: type II secretion system F family protein, partial [Candidatus Nanoarchaeia archaeon]|nr:type II secretion system F family protein [Candidatus Nanoarchaeia archaeon]